MNLDYKQLKTLLAEIGTSQFIKDYEIVHNATNIVRKLSDIKIRQNRIDLIFEGKLLPYHLFDSSNVFSYRRKTEWPCYL